MTKKFKLNPDLRIFVLLPETVQIPLGTKGERFTSIRMETGRLITQGEHVVSKMRVERAEKFGSEPITTINYSVRNSKELMKVATEMENSVPVYYFYDKNRKFYGHGEGVLTAVCTGPTFRHINHLEEAIGHLELFGKGHD